MELLKFVRLSVVVISMVSGKRLSMEDIKQLDKEHVKLLGKDPRQGQVMCARLSKEPYFGVDMLVGRTWRIYYTWNMDLRKQCMDMSFRNATPAIIKRFYNDMNDYLQLEPYWDAATVQVTLGRPGHKMLLFADQEAAGRFQGVPNIIRDGSNIPLRKSVPLLKFQLKLMYGGKYLLMSDCQIGVTTLSAPRRTLPYRAEIGSIADHLDFGPGLHACQSEKNMDENAPKE